MAEASDMAISRLDIDQKTRRTFFSLRVPLSIARVTFSEVLRDKVLAQILVLTALLFLVTLITSQVSSRVSERVLVDFSWGALLISSLVLAVSQGAIALKRELDRRTLFLVLARPIYRFQWYLGKFFGLGGIFTINVILFTLVTEFLFWLYLDPSTFTVPPTTRLSADFLLLMQALLVGAIAMFFSTMTSSSLSMALTFGLYLIGSSHSQILWLSDQNQGAAREFIRLCSYLIPNFEGLHLSRYLTYGIAVDAPFLFSRVGYALLWCLIFLVLGGLRLRRKEF
jgi:Cu-processing system permease protein